MALIGDLKRGTLDRMTLHDRIDATYYTQERDGLKLLQINSFGRETRENPGKASQSFQLDERSGKQLFDVLKSHFGFK